MFTELKEKQQKTKSRQVKKGGGVQSPGGLPRSDAGCQGVTSGWGSFLSRWPWDKPRGTLCLARAEDAVSGETTAYSSLLHPQLVKRLSALIQYL